MPCTEPNAKLTAAIPASTPVATGMSDKISTRGERKNDSSNAAIITTAMIDNRSASLRIASRVLMAKMPGPVTSKLSCFAPLCSTTAAKR